MGSEFSSDALQLDVLWYKIQVFSNLLQLQKQVSVFAEMHEIEDLWQQNSPYHKAVSYGNTVLFFH